LLELGELRVIRPQAAPLPVKVRVAALAFLALRHMVALGQVERRAFQPLGLVEGAVALILMAFQTLAQIPLVVAV
jgi:hypothetical protein